MGSIADLLGYTLNAEGEKSDISPETGGAINEAGEASSPKTEHAREVAMDAILEFVDLAPEDARGDLTLKNDLDIDTLVRYAIVARIEHELKLSIRDTEVDAWETLEDVLSDVTFTAKQGEVTALVGPSGGGKSTTAKLAARFWDIQKGTITMGGVDISTVDPETLLKDYAIVFQDVVLFNDTIMGNIRLGRKDATDEEVMAAARASQCDEFVQRLPEGYQTVVGENGSTLSGGERQRISIARALLKNAPIVLLDEATASLDVENETSLQTALSALLKDKTVLVIAHRMRTVMGADHVVVLADGHVAEEGTPEQLMERGGMFRRMVELQRETSSWQVGGNRGGA